MLDWAEGHGAGLPVPLTDLLASDPATAGQAKLATDKVEFAPGPFEQRAFFHENEVILRTSVAFAVA